MRVVALRVPLLERDDMRRVADGEGGDLLQRHGPHALQPVERDHAAKPTFAEDKLSQVLRALVQEPFHGRAALVGRRLAHEDERLVVLLAGAYLAQAVDRLEVRLGQEEEHDRSGLDVALEKDEVLEVVHVQEDLHACWWVGQEGGARG